ncbi:MAG: ABC transporter permease [Firmicutes bacterium]|nr:ABC transporter permease [Bacillota bacterium]
MFLMLIKKELKENRFLLSVWFLISILFAILQPLSYDYLLRMMEGSASQPWQQVALQVFRDYRLYLWLQWFGKTGYQSATIFAVLLGMGLIASEVGRKTMDFLLTKPVDRGTVWAGKFLTAGLALWSGLTLSVVSLLLAADFSGLPVEWGWFWQGLPGLLAGSAVLLGVVALFSALFDDRIKAGLVASGVLLILSIPSWIPRLHWLSVYYQMAGHETLRLGHVPWPTVLLLLGVAAALYRLGLAVFQRREF